MRRSRYPSARDALRWLTAFAFTVVGAVALIGNRIQAAGNDAVFTQSLVDRAARFGGTYYENGITPKGPLEDVAHDIALRIGGYDGRWYVISIMIAMVIGIPNTFPGVPEPSTVMAGILLLMPFGTSALRTMRRKSAV